MVGLPTDILVRLRPYQATRCLAKQIHEIRRPFVIGKVDLTNCIRLQFDEVTRRIFKCTQLRSLQCIACHLTWRDVLELMMT
ncbi:hypothetical protein MRX96_017467 [Rhipicephalus microplus]